jgi:hypothetical protein
MIKLRTQSDRRITFAALILATVLLILGSAGAATAQRRPGTGSAGTLEAGTTIPVRTVETISANSRNEQVFSGVIDRDVVGRNGSVAIPKGSEVELALKPASTDQLTFDLVAMTIDGQQYYPVTESNRLILARGRRVPAQSLLTFRLTQQFRPRVAEDGYSPAYRAGLRAGRSDADRNLRRNTQSGTWSTPQDRRDYEAGYNEGYDRTLASTEGYTGVQSATPGYERGSVSIRGDNNISWQAGEDARVYVQVDNEPFKLFAEGRSGIQGAPWIEPGHRYLVVLQDLNGNEIARDVVDLRRSNRGRAR